MTKSRLALLAVIGLGSVATVAVPAIAEEPVAEEAFVCTAEQVLGPFLGRLLPITFSPEVAATFGVDPAECVTPVGQF